MERSPTDTGWNGQLPSLEGLQRFCLLLGYLHPVLKYGDEVEELSVLVSIVRRRSRDVALGLTLDIL